MSRRDDSGLDCLGIDDEIGGLDFMNIAKGAAGMLSGTGGLLASGSGNKDDVKAAVERLRLEDERRRAEESASKTRLALGVSGAAIAALLVAHLRGNRSKS